VGRQPPQAPLLIQISFSYRCFASEQVIIELHRHCYLLFHLLSALGFLHFLRPFISSFRSTSIRPGLYYLLPTLISCALDKDNIALSNPRPVEGPSGTERWPRSQPSLKQLYEAIEYDSCSLAVSRSIAAATAVLSPPPIPPLRPHVCLQLPHLIKFPSSPS
jgi:hypothetical protein